MEEDIIKKADILMEAYPFIKSYRDKIFVIKFGGSIMRLNHLETRILQDIAFLELVGIKTILVCGGGPFINEEIEKRGKKPEFIEGLRVSDEDTIGVVQEILFGIRDKIVAHFNEKLDVSASALKPEEDFISARKIHYQKGEEIIDLGYVGQVAGVNTDYIKERLESRRILVAAPLAFAPDRRLYNINGDSFAAGIAEALIPEKLIFLTDVPGVMRNPDNPETLISVLRSSDIDNLSRKDIIKDGMTPKVKAALSAIGKGMHKAHIISGSISHAILLEVFTEHGVGTEIMP